MDKSDIAVVIEQLPIPLNFVHREQKKSNCLAHYVPSILSSTLPSWFDSLVGSFLLICLFTLFINDKWKNAIDMVSVQGPKCKALSFMYLSLEYK